MAGSGTEHYNYFRDYDAALGRYLQSDPLGLGAGPNTFQYASASPLRLIDRFGLTPIPDPNGIVPGGPWTPAQGQKPGDFWGPKKPNGGRDLCRYVPDEKNGGPRGAAEPYWKTQSPGQNGWNRYNSKGKPISPNEAHGPPLRRVPNFPFLLCPLCEFLQPQPDDSST